MDKIARELVSIARELTARVPSSVRRRVEKSLYRHYDEDDFDDYDALYDVVQDIVFMDPDIPEDPRGEDTVDLDVVNEWTNEISEDLARKFRLTIR